MSRYPFDPALRARVTDLLYDLLPALHRVRDMPPGAMEPLRLAAPAGTEPLYQFLHVLAAPLAAARQNVDELHADLFIDSCADWVLPYLGEMIGVTLVFPDAETNRRDVRGTMAWRRRKGTPWVLQEMGSELSGRMAVTQEGWKRLAMTQDLRLLRLQRTVPDVRPIVLAEQVEGPLDNTFHALDPRHPGRREGRYHPKHITHWSHATQLFPLHDGEAGAWTPPDPVAHPPPYNDRRYCFDPHGRQTALRIRRADPSDAVATDRVPPMHFAASPGDYFDDEGTSQARFTVRILGLVAGVAAPSTVARTASDLPADDALSAGPVAMTLLSHHADRWTEAVEVELMAVPLIDGGSGVLDTPDVAVAEPRGGLTIDASGGATLAGNATPVGSDAVAMVRLRPAASAAYFPGVTVELAGAVLGATLASTEPALARRGFLRGALQVELPGTWVYGERWLYVAADGSVFDAQSPAAASTGAAPDVALTPELALPGVALVVGPGPAWPPTAPSASVQPWKGLPLAPIAGPRVVHGGAVVDASGPTLAPVSGAAQHRLVLSLRERTGSFPFLALEWTGADPTSASSFIVFDANGQPATNTAQLRAAFSSLAERVELGFDEAELRVAFHAPASGSLLPPCEFALTSDDGNHLLVYLPSLLADASGGTLGFVSDEVVVADDGATLRAGTSNVVRLSFGPVMPLGTSTTLRRRQVVRRTLCPWDNEVPPAQLHEATPTGQLAIDPQHGLFAMASGDPIPTHSTSLEGMGPPPPVTVDAQEGYSMHVGARPAARGPVLQRALATPTRLVVGRGRFHREATRTWHDIPRYATLSAALAAIALDPDPNGREVVQVEDSAIYDEAPTWPASITDLTLQAAEGERPVLRLSADWTAAASASYDRLELIGLVIAQGGATVAFPSTGELQVAMCSTVGRTGRWQLEGDERGRRELVFRRCVLARIELSDRARLALYDCLIHAAGGRAITADDGRVKLERATVLTERGDLVDGVGTRVRVLSASECLFVDRVVALDRFDGCVRYSRVAPESILPRRHRVVGDTDDPVQAERERPRFMTLDPADPAHARLAEHCDRSMTRGAEDGSEMGAFHGAQLGLRQDGLRQRLNEYAPADLITGVPRRD
ncbi:MAG: phage tail protein [Myxococcota bacterium]